MPLRLSLLTCWALLIAGVAATALAEADCVLCQPGTANATHVSHAHGQTMSGLGAAETSAGWFKLFDTSDFPARWNCGNWSSLHGWVHIVGDSLIFGAYAAIPILLFWFIRRRKDMPFPKVMWLFIAFIASCGIGHLWEAIIFWWPAYRLAGANKLVTAAVSWATVFALIPVLPKALKLPGLAKVNADLEQARGLLSERNQELNERNEQLSQLMNTLSHDLKSPLATSRGYLMCIREDLKTGDTAAVEDSLQQIDEANDRFSAVIDDILELSRVGSVALVKETVDVARVLEGLRDEFKPRFDQAGLVFEADLDALPSGLLADRRQLHEVFENLLTNAIKYGSGGDDPRVELSAVTTRTHVRFFVRDHGPGIKPEYLESIFKPFIRLHGKAIRGTGLGLAIVARIMKAHGGRAWVESEVGQGATFWVEFPLDVAES